MKGQAPSCRPSGIVKQCVQFILSDPDRPELQVLADKVALSLQQRRLVPFALMKGRVPDRIRAHALICCMALVLYRVMHMRQKAKGHSASPRSALSLLARIQKHTAHAGTRSFHCVSKTTAEQLDLFDALNLPKPAGPPRRCHAFFFSA
jgi:hypothetical protein